MKSACWLRYLKAFRTPLLSLLLGLWFARDHARVPNLAIAFQDALPLKVGLNLWVIRPDYFLYLPNLVTCLAYLVGIGILLEVGPWLLPAHRSPRANRVIALIGGGIALSLLGFMANRKPGVMQLFISGAQVFVLWFFMMANAGLPMVDRMVERTPWVVHVLEWTFPVSDVFCYRLHRRRMAVAGPCRYVPSACYLMVVMLVLCVEGRMLWGATRAERVAVPVEDAQYALPVHGGFWFTNGNLLDARSGIWYYSDQSQTASPVIRTGDCRQFYFDGSSFYLHDRYDNYVRRVDAKTHRIIWEVPVENRGTYQVVGREGVIFAAGEDGYLLTLDTNGQVLGQRTFSPLGTWVPQAVWGRQVAFLSGDERVHLWNAELTAGTSVSLPLAPGVRRFVWDASDGRMRTVTDWTDYVDQTDTLYVQTLWGEIFRYDVKRQRWQPSLKTKPGLRTIAVEPQHGLLFAWNYYGGYIDVIDVASGVHVGYILAGALGRYINFDPVRMVGIASTHGYGVWRFRYDHLVRRREALNRRPPHDQGM